jgi:PIN domain nuclease of toxin-antitoxin system
MAEAPPILLDTCAVIYASIGDEMAIVASEAIKAASQRSQLYISPISAWEIGMLMSKRRLKSPLAPAEFLRRFLASFNAAYAALSSEILIDSSFLPSFPHGDPTDRTLVATARNLDMILVTSDRPILRYGEEGHVRALAC